MNEYENQEPQTILEDAVKRVRQLQEEADTARQTTNTAAKDRKVRNEALQKLLENLGLDRPVAKEAVKKYLTNFGMDRPVTKEAVQEYLENFAKDRPLANDPLQEQLENRRNETSLPLPEMELTPVASLGPCQILAVTARDSQRALEYVLAAKAMAEKDLVIEEISRHGSVPTLLVQNQLEMPVLILEGDLLIGGKQNRLSNSSVLIPKKTTMPLPVSCIEHGRWRHKSPRPESTRPESPRPESFAPSDDCIAAPVHRELKRAKLSSRPTSVQAKVWDSIEDMQQARAYCSKTSDHEELLKISRSELEEFLESTRCPDDAVGVAVVVGEESYALDLFDQPETCRHYWKMKIHSSLLQRGRLHNRESLFSAEALEADIQELQDSRWQVRRGHPTGRESRLGRELQTLTERRSMATALTYEQLPVHLTLLSQN